MRNNLRKTLHQIRETIVILYEISTFFVPLIFLFLAVNDTINLTTMMFGMFFYLFPVLFRVGVFGDKAKLVTDKLMGIRKYKK